MNVLWLLVGITVIIANSVVIYEKKKHPEYKYPMTILILNILIGIGLIIFAFY